MLAAPRLQTASRRSILNENQLETAARRGVTIPSCPPRTSGDRRPGIVDSDAWSGRLGSIARSTVLGAARAFHRARYSPPDYGDRLPGARAGSGHDGGTLILGAGLAGLAAAHRLVAHGRPVEILEARDRPGGRVWTLRKEFPGFDGVEAGAARIRDDHLWTRRYLDHFDLPLEPFYPQEGHLVVKTDGGRNLMPAGLPSWQCHPVVTSGRLRTGGALEAFRRARWYGVGGGADRLPRKMASLLAERIQYAAEVTRLDRGEERVSVTYLRNGRRQERTAGRLVCSLPFTTLRSVELAPPLPPKKGRILQELSYQSAIRVFVEVSRCPWEDRGMNGFGWSEEIGEIWQLSPRPGTNGASRLLVSYARGDRARRLSRLEDPELTDRVVEELDILFPGVAEHAGRTRILRWDRQPWSLGAQSLAWELEPPPPPELRRPAGRIHFAGEHVASPRSVGWMDGALESGWRAADAILKGQ